MRRRKMLQGERLMPGCLGYGFSREDCAKGGRKSAEKRRERSERHKRILRAYHLRQNRAHNEKAWKRERDAKGRFLPFKGERPGPKATEATKAPEPTSTSRKARAYRLPLAYGRAECEKCGWFGPEYNLVKHTRMKHASPTSPWHPRNAGRRSAQVRKAKLQERKRREEEAQAGAGVAPSA